MKAFMQCTHVDREPSWAEGWQWGHSNPSVVCERGERGSWSSPPLPWLDTPPVLSLCHQLINLGAHLQQSPGWRTRILKMWSNGHKKKSMIWVYLFCSLNLLNVLINQPHKPTVLISFRLCSKAEWLLHLKEESSSSHNGVKNNIIVGWWQQIRQS